MRMGSAAASRPDRPRASRVRVVGVPHAYNIVATEDIEEGEALFHVDGATTDRPSRYSIQIDERTHIDFEPGATLEEIIVGCPWRFLNHSCEPNAVLRGRNFVALRAIAAGEDVTYNYNTTESDLAAPFDCRCGHDLCVGRISGFAHLPPVEQTRLRPWLADYLRRRLDSALRSATA